MTTTLTHPFRLEITEPTPRRRIREYRYVIDEPTATKRGETVRAVLTVSVADWSDRKVYRVNVDRQTQAGIWTRQVIDFKRDAPDYVRALPFVQARARYSQKAMVALHDQVIAELIEPQLERLLDWAAGALDLQD